MSTEEQTPPDDTKYPDELIEGHEYDGIREYDNPTPTWLLLIFYGTLAWSIFYIAALGIGWIDDYDAQLEDRQDELAQMRADSDGDSVGIDEEMLTSRMGNDEAIGRGKETFDQICSACHGKEGGGGAGPAFTDGEWKYGEAPMDQFKIVKNGAAGGMPAHEGQLSNEEMADVVAYIRTFSE